MKNGRSLILTLLVGSSIVRAQSNPPSAQQAARDIMRAARYATFVTNGRDGQPQARIVDPRVEEDVRTIWVATNPKSRKVAELARDARVTLLFFNPAQNEYVTAIGRARIEQDMAAMSRHWKPEWTRFYPIGKTGRQVVIYAISVSRLELVSSARGFRSDSVTWRPVIESVRP